jgi:hypothetical protein
MDPTDPDGDPDPSVIKRPVYRPPNSYWITRYQGHILNLACISGLHSEEVWPAHQSLLQTRSVGLYAPRIRPLPSLQDSPVHNGTVSIFVPLQL